MSESLLIELMVLIVVIWYFQMRARERTLNLARQVCAEMALQLLDDTVTICHMSLKRTPDGQMCIRRIYTFDFTDQTENLRQGTVIYLGDHLESLLIGDSPVIRH
ncbi:MAG: DUF3301 domain-containing protein [Magnetococcus sp. DMHC-1]|nr:DUF3301 domain-containing protein [Magnetococcales bacterium]